MTRAFEDHQIRQYLLGDLPASEEGELETAYFADAALLARVELAKDDLADDYAAARLSAADQQKFERRILATDEGREQLAVSRALQKAAAGAPQTTQSHSWHIDRRWLSLAAVVPLAIGAAFFAWRVASGPARVGERTDASGARTVQAPTPISPPSTVAPDQPAAGDPPRSGSLPGIPGVTLATLILTADLERSGGLPPTLLASSGATHVDLVAPRNGLQSGTARARVESAEGKSVWSGSITVPEVDAPDPRPRARVPLSVLPPGDYLLSIVLPARTDPSGELQFYFRVRAR